jgi:hypothetical protein
MLLGHMAVGNFGSGGFYWLKKTHPNIVITGYPTKNLADDQQVFQRGLGDLDVAIIGTIKIGSSTYLHAVPYAQIGKGLTKAQFSNMLRKGVGPREAVELIRQLDEIAIEHPKSVQTSDSKQPKGTGRASSTPTGKTVVWVDLLKLIDPNKHDVSADLHGTWSKSSQGLQTTGKAKRRPVSIEIPYRPGNEYDLQALFTRPADTTGFICPLGDKAFGLSFGPRSTWCRIGGHEKVQFTSKNGQLTALLLSVRRDSVRVVVDGKQILQHRIQDIKIETPGPPDWLRGNNLGIIVHSAKMTFQKIAIREVGKK